eukprot:5773527-Prymnesium_polylepis.3
MWSYSACASDSGAARRALAAGGSSGDGETASVAPEPLAASRVASSGGSESATSLGTPGG